MTELSLCFSHFFLINVRRYLELLRCAIREYSRFHVDGVYHLHGGFLSLVMGGYSPAVVPVVTDELLR